VELFRKKGLIAAVLMIAGLVLIGATMVMADPTDALPPPPVPLPIPAPPA